MLSSLYSYADIAYIGGGFGSGIHNTLEAAVYEIPVMFGKNYKKFKEAIELIQEGIAFEINTAQDISTITSKIQQAQGMKQITINCQRYIQKHSGATSIILNYITDNNKFL